MYQTSHDEGRIVDGVYEYNITDQNNNLRISFKDSLGIAVPTQSIFYDPWGLSMKGMSITRNPLNFNRYQFLNRETQFETGLIDLKNRQYNPQTGRFTSQDPVIDGQESQSLYQYGWNNPVLRSDPNGLIPDLSDLLQRAKTYIANKITQTASNIAHATVKAFKQGARDLVNNTEVAVYGKAGVSLTSGAGGAAEVKGLGVDARYRHVELLSGGVELDSKKGGSANGNYAGKNGDQKQVSAVSAGFVLEGGYSKEKTTNNNGNVTTKSEIDAGGVYGAIPTPLGALPVGAGVKLSKESSATGNTYETRVEAARTGAKLGTPFTFSFDASIGIRATYTPKKDD